MTVKFLAPKPTEPGLYAAEIYFGWKLLTWKHDCWMIEGGVATWAAGDPVQWVGPLPDLIRKDPKPAEQWSPERIARALEENAPPLQPNKLPPMEFDL